MRILDKRNVHFLGHVVSSKGIHVDPFKIKVVKNWEALKMPIEFRQCLGLVGYYQRFIEKISCIVKPLTTLTQKDVKFVWRYQQETTFQKLKEMLCSAPTLSLPKGIDDFVVYCDA